MRAHRIFTGVTVVLLLTHACPSVPFCSFCFYVLLQSALTATSDEPPEPIVGEFTVASSMPAVIDVFTPLAHELKLLTKSDNGSAMIGRAITGVVAMVVQATPPLYTLDCDSARLHSLRGTMYAMQRTQACDNPLLRAYGFAFLVALSRTL